MTTDQINNESLSAVAVTVPPSPRPRRHVIQVRLNDAEHAALAVVARASGETNSNFVRRSLYDKAAFASAVEERSS